MMKSFAIMSPSALLLLALPAISGTAQTIFFPEIPPQLFPAGGFELLASASSGLPITYSIVSPPGVATVNGRMVTMSGVAGAVTVRASQPGGGGYDAAPDAYQSFIVELAGDRWAKVRHSNGHFAGVKMDGTLWAWGTNSSGQVGNGTTLSQASPVQVGGANSWIDVACGASHTLAIMADGTLWAWGLNSSGQLGDGTTTVRLTPVRTGTATNWVSVTCGDNFSAGIKTDGSLWLWGQNTSGQLGNGNTTSFSTPLQLGTSGGWASASCGTSHTLAIKTDGTLWGWGRRADGQLGDGTGSVRLTPAQIGTAIDWAALSCGANASYSLKTDGSLWAWGTAGTGGLGVGDTFTHSTPTRIGLDADWQSVVCNGTYSVAVKANATLWSWGVNTNGQLGDGTTATRTSPVQIGLGTEWSAPAGATMALDGDGTVWKWGFSGLTQGDIPIPVGTDTFWAAKTAVAAGSYSMVVDQSGVLWGWGSNTSGQLADGTTVSRSVPLPVGSGDVWKLAAAAANRFIGLKADGTLWGAGGGILGDGLGGTHLPLSPVNFDTDWIQVACGGTHTAALKQDGTLWAWGYNTYGQLGDGLTSQQLSPKLVGVASDWAAVACGDTHTVALKWNGTLWSWGQNQYGQTGSGANFLPTQVGSESLWRQVACGGSFTAAIKADGTLWMWGVNSSGQLGDSGTSRGVPTKVGNDNNWASVACGQSHTAAIKTDGTLWTWGSSVNGRLGRPIAAGPGQVGTARNWHSVSCGGAHTLASRVDGTLMIFGNNDSGQLGDGAQYGPLRAWPPQAAQSISFPPMGSIHAGQAVSVTATATSGMPVLVTAGGVAATLDGEMLTPTEPGFLHLSAYQNGSAAWMPAQSVLQTIRVTDAPEVELGTPTGVWRGGATLQAMVTPNGTVTTALFQYGTTASYGSTVPVVLGGNDEYAPQAATATLTGLSSNTLYHYRLTATNTDGSVSTADGTFTTLAAPSLSVEHPGGTPLASSVSTVDFGRGYLGEVGVTLHFVIRNNGPGPLNGLQFQLVRDGALDFAVASDSVPAEIPKNGSAGFSIVFRPIFEGVREAWLQISSNDPAQNPFVVFLEGLAAYRPTISFAAIPGQIAGTFGTSFGLAATASSGLPVSYSLMSGAGVASLNGDTITLTGTPGAVTIRASQLGDASHGAALDSYNSFFVVPESQRFVEVAFGNLHAVGLRADGTLWTWGYQLNGELGIVGIDETRIPRQVGNETDWTAVASRMNTTLALKSNGTLWGWGMNAFGQIGDGTTATRYVPQQVGTDADWTMISCGGQHSAAVKTDGTLWTWGANNSRQLGDGTTTNRLSPVQVGTSASWISASCGQGFTAAIRTNGTLWTWGSNASGQLGVGQTDPSSRLPGQVTAANNWARVVCGDGTAVAVKTDGSLWSWGSNSYGQIGDGTMINRNGPVRVGADNDWSFAATSGYATAAVKTDGTLWMWGQNSFGTFGTQEPAQRSSPGQVGTANNWTKADVSAWATLALTSNGELWGWGSPSRLGRGPSTYSSPLHTQADHAWKKIACGYSTAAAVRADGTLWTWGADTMTDDDSQLATQVGTDSDWDSVSCGYYFVIARKTNGTLWAWGENDLGQTGIGGGAGDPANFARVGTDSDWAFVACGEHHSLALKTDGSLWVWGNNFAGQLGVGSTTESSSPRRLGTETNWKSIACGVAHSLAIKSDGTLWAWGYNSTGQLGLGTVTNVTTPNQVGSANDWESVAGGDGYSLAVRRDGSLWAWGRNDVGQLGDGTTIQRNAPVQVGNGGVSAVSAAFSNSLLLKRDGSLWNWGQNPSQIGSAQNWASIACGGDFNAAIRTDGSLWLWGDNYYLQLDIPDWFSPARSWPEQVSQSITFPEPSIISVGQQTQLAAVASSGLPITYTVVGPASLDGTVLTANAAGPITVSAYQRGNDVWSSAEPAVLMMAATGPPSLSLSAPISVSMTDATLAGSVTPNGLTTTAQFEYGPTANYGSSVVAPISPADGLQPQQASAHISGLEPGAVYHFRLTASNASGNSSTEDLVFSTLPAPEIRVEQQAGVALTNGAGSVDFGDVIAGSSGGALTFSVLNTGIGALEDLEISLDGIEASDFVLDAASLPTTIAPGQSATFTIIFSPTAVSGRSATLRIQSNDLVNGEFSVALTGIGSPLPGPEQSIIFPKMADVPSNTPPFHPSAASTSGLPVSFTIVSPPGVAEVIDGSIVLTGTPGIVTVAASQPGDASYHAAATEYRSFAVTPAGERFVSIVAEDHFSAGIRADGTLWKWDNNRAVAAQFGTDSDWACVRSGSNHVAALKSDGSLWAWGANDWGQIGRGNGIDTSSPGRVGSSTDWTMLDCGAGYTMALKSDGTLWGWGRNTSGFLGTGTTINQYTPIQIGSDNDWAAIACGDYHCLAIKANGTLWAWGENTSGQVGDGSTIARKNPVQIGSDDDWVFASAGQVHSAALKADGTLWTWGSNVVGALGDGTAIDRHSPQKVGSSRQWTSVACGANRTAGLKSDGSLWVWGDNLRGHLGDGTESTRFNPTRVGSDHSWTSVSCAQTHTLAVSEDGALWAWGRMIAQLPAENRPTAINSPVQIGTETDWRQFSCAGSHSLAIKRDGTLWAWGYNYNGQLGDGAENPQTFPVQVPGTNWVSAQAGLYSSGALKSNGSLWMWGGNSTGELGSITGSHRNTPTQMGTATDWLALACGGSHTVALKQDHSLWAWGLDVASLNQVSPPARVGGDSDWVAISAGDRHSAALKSGGSLWTWGTNSSWQLGDGTATFRGLPVHIGTDIDWALVSCGDEYTAALKHDNSLWAWGTNIGQFGNGTTTDYSRPISIGAVGGWASIVTGYRTTYGLKTDGTLWSWGSSRYGELGLGSITYTTTPAQIGSDSDWIGVKCSGAHVLAQKSDGTLWGWGSNFYGELGIGAPLVPTRGWPTRQSQTISFPNLNQPEIGQPITLQATSDSGLPVVFSFAGPATLTGSILTPLSAGEIRVNASQLGDENWQPATRVSQIISVLGGFAEAAAAAGLTGTDANPAATPFLDGVPNLLKYAFNMNLTGPDSSTMVPGGNKGLPAVRFSDSLVGGGTIQILFVRRRNSDLTYAPQASSSLAEPNSWTSLNVQPTVTEIDATWENVLYEIPVSAERQFFRIWVRISQ